MKKHWKLIIIMFIGLVPAISKAQQADPKEIIEAIIESYPGNIDGGTDIELMVEDLENLAENPININATNATELSRLYILNTIQINRLLNYLKNYGPAYSIFEMQTIEGINREVLEKIEPFIYFGVTTAADQSLRDELKYAKHNLLLRGLGSLQKARGYKLNDQGNIPYEGNRFRYYTRYNFTSDDRISAGLTAEKDAGEAFFKGSNKHGFDYYSGHLRFKPKGIFENISLGDFMVRAGQGLVLWQGHTSGKSENVLGIPKKGQGIRSYTSVDENSYFRGIATKIRLGRSQLSLFYSHKNVDANIVDSDSSTHFTSLQTSGYHRTQNEINDEKSIKNYNTGGVYTWNSNNLELGITFVYQHFNKSYTPVTHLYNHFRFRGKENYTGGINYLFSKGKYQVFGEAALSKSKGRGFVQGAVAHLNDQLGFSVLFRHFDKNYQALWANTFAEGSNISNESGLYFGTRFLPAKFVAISAYSDIYRSDWINFSTAGPSVNWDIFIQTNLRFSDKINVYIRFKNEEKQQKIKDDKRYVNLPERLQKTRLHFQYKASETFTFKTRLEHVYYRGKSPENDFLIFQDLQYSSMNRLFKLSARLAYFTTESYESRIYAYENDLLYTFSIPAYYGQGLRTYLNLSYKLTHKIQCWLKLANTHWTDRNSISSGYNEIEGSNKTELKFQLRLKF